MTQQGQLQTVSFKITIMLKNIYIKPIITLFLFILIFACSKDEDPEPAHEHELITLVTLEVTKVGSSETVKYNFEFESF